MWLDSLGEQVVSIPALGRDVRFESGEGIRTEISAKFTPESATRMLERGGSGAS